MNEEEAVRIFDIVVKEHMLPATLDKLVPLSFMGAAAVKFYQAKVKLMDQLGATEEQRKATLSDGQDAGEMLLDIEARIGELALQEPPEYHKPIKGGSKGAHYPVSSPPKHERLGMKSEASMKTSETIFKNKETVKAIIKEARENEDIPTKTAVLNKIRADKAEAAAAKYKAEVTAKKGSNTATTKGEALKYLSKLREVVLILPVEVPSDGWSEGSFAEAQGMAEIIIRRLEPWQK